MATVDPPEDLASEWDTSYHTTPPWDIGRPQPALLAVAAAGGLRGRTLDVGCGTGEHVLMAASFGHDATGVDISPAAIRLARKKAAARGMTGARFVVGDMLSSETAAALPGPFDTITDSGVFHVFSDAGRQRYVANLRSLLTDGGRYLMLVFSDEEPGDWGPRRVTRDELHAALADGWQIESIEPVRMETTIEPAQVRCWLTIATAVPA